jgi:hypothetical protein
MRTRRLVQLFVICVSTIGPLLSAELHTTTPVTKAWQQFTTNKQQSSFSGISWAWGVDLHRI